MGFTHWYIQKQRVIVHTTHLTFNGQDMVFRSNRLERVRIRNHGADGHDLICPVGFCIDNSEITHVSLSLVVLWTVYWKMRRKASYVN